MAVINIFALFDACVYTSCKPQQSNFTKHFVVCTKCAPGLEWDANTVMGAYI